MLWRAVALSAVLLASAGCAPTFRNPFVVPTGKVTLDRQQFVNTYEALKTIYIRARPIADNLCSQRELSEAQCQAMSESEHQLLLVDLEIQTVLRNPEVVPNWELIGKLVSALAGAII